MTREELKAEVMRWTPALLGMGKECTDKTLEAQKQIVEMLEVNKEYEVEVITRGNCMICGKELTDGLFFCKECEDKASGRKHGRMNNKEAIAKIKGMRFQVQSSLDEIEVDVDSKEAEQDNREIVEAFDMATKALDREEKVLQALEDVRAEVDKYDVFNDLVDKYEVLKAIDRKIAEVTHDE